MRNIKFRGKRIDNGEWVFGWLVIQPDGTAFISTYYKRGEWVQVDPKTVGQYTGYKARYKVEMYDGDVWLPYGMETPRVIVWHRYGWWFRHLNGGVTRPIEWTEDGEVIGNIHDNPELLTGGNANA